MIPAHAKKGTMSVNGRQHSPLTALFERFSLGRDNIGVMLLRG